MQRSPDGGDAGKNRNLPGHPNTRPVLKELGQPEAFDLQLEGGKLILSPLHKKPREGWDGAFAQMAAQGDDTLLIDDALDADLTPSI